MTISIDIIKMIVIIIILLCIMTFLMGYILGFIKGFRKAKYIDDQIIEELSEKYNGDNKK